MVPEVPDARAHPRTPSVLGEGQRSLPLLRMLHTRHVSSQLDLELRLPVLEDVTELLKEPGPLC